MREKCSGEGALMHICQKDSFSRNNPEIYSDTLFSCFNSNDSSQHVNCALELTKHFFRCFSKRSIILSPS